MPTTTPIKLKPIDLCPKKPDPNFLGISNTVVTIDVQIKTKAKPVPPVVLKRLEMTVVAKTIKNYADIIQEETLRLEAKIKALVADNNINPAKKKVAVETMQNATQHSIRNAVASLQGAVDAAIVAQLKQDAKDDRDLLEAQVLVVLKGALIALKIGISVAKLAVTHGADVSAYVSLAKNALEIVKLVTAALATEYKVRGEYRDALGKYRQAAANASPANKKKLDDKLDEIRRNHRLKVVGLRQDLEKLSTRGDELLNKAKVAKTLPNGVALGAKSMEIKRSVNVKLKEYLEIEQVAKDLADKAVAMGAVQDNRTLMEKITLKDVTSFAKEIKDIINDIIELAAA